jgi:hypothetical protein
MGKGIVVIILDLLRLESKLIVAAFRDASVIRGVTNVTNSENFEFSEFIHDEVENGGYTGL